LPVEALAAMDLKLSGRLRLVKTMLEIVGRAEDGAANNLGVTYHRGPPINDQAVCATPCAGRAWHTLTGKKPNPGLKNRGTGERSDFEQFLGQIFDALKIKANPEHYARELRKEAWRKTIEQRFRGELNTLKKI